jgi:hypothetical protein
MKSGQGAKRREGLTAEAKRLEGGEVVVGGDFGRMVLESYRLEVVWSNACTVILDLDGAQAIVLEVDFYPVC